MWRASNGVCRGPPPGPVVDAAGGQGLGLRRPVGQPDDEQAGRVRAKEGRLKWLLRLPAGADDPRDRLAFPLVQDRQRPARGQDMALSGRR